MQNEGAWAWDRIKIDEKEKYTFDETNDIDRIVQSENAVFSCLYKFI